jgi:hypothetical protein
MDPIGVTSSITTILQLTRDVMKFFSRVKDAPTACNKILMEISSINGILSSIKELVDEADSDKAWLSTVRSLGGPNGPLEQSKSALEKIASHIEPIAGSRKTRRAFIWPLREDEVTDILRTLERQKALLILALQNDHMSAFAKALFINRRLLSIGHCLKRLNVILQVCGTACTKSAITLPS